MTERFYKLPADVAARRDLRPADKLVLAYLSYRIGDNGVCWPGCKRIAGDLGLARCTVMDIIRRLEAHAEGFTVERQGNGRVNRYRLDTANQSENPTGRETRPVGKPDTHRSGNPTGTGRETRHKKKEPVKEPPTAPFDRFWQAWPRHPRKRDKAACKKKWDTDSLDARAVDVLAVLAREKRGEQWTKNGGNFIPAPLTWLRRKRWKDPPEDYADAPPSDSQADANRAILTSADLREGGAA